MKTGARILSGLLLVALMIFLLTREPKKPTLPRWEAQEELLTKEIGKSRKSADMELVKGLLSEGLSHREFEFPVVVDAVAGKKVIALQSRASRAGVLGSIERVMSGVLEEMNGEESPLRGLRRINEGSKYFEDALRVGLQAVEGISCEIPKTRDGKEQRSGYPDLRITDDATGEVYYLDPKLMESGSVGSTLRTFYFEPKTGTLKITEDATHLLIGIEHDGNDGKWKFTGYRLVDLSGLKVRLKAEFQASNREIYKDEGMEMERRPGGKE